MLRLAPTYRLFRSQGRPLLESVLQERAIDVDEVLLGVVRTLAAGPVAGAGEIAEALAGEGLLVERGPLHAALTQLQGLSLLRVGPAMASFLWDDIATGRTALPIVDNVELTNICPMECVMCPTGTGRMTRKKGNMERALFVRLIDEIAAAGGQPKPVTLHNLGESLLHPELPPFVRLCRERGLRTEVSGNPGHLPLSLYQALEEAGLDRLVISLDGLDAQTLTGIRGRGARADLAFDHVEQLLAWRRDHPRDKPEIVLQMVRQQKNRHQAADFVPRYDRGLASVQVYVKELDANTVEEGPLRIIEDDRPARPYLCRAPWRTVVVLQNGDVVPCCHDENGAVVYGNLANQSLAEIWNSETAQALRTRLASATLQKSEPCFDCAHRADRYRPSPVPATLDGLVEEPLLW